MVIMTRIVLGLSDNLMIILRILAVRFLVIFQDLFRDLVKRDLSTLVQSNAALENTKRGCRGN